MKRHRALRRVIQIAAVLWLLPQLFIADAIWVGSYISSSFLGIDITDPLTALEVSIAGHTVYGPLLLSAIPLLLIAVLGGRLFCSYICPLNLLLELLPLARRRRHLREKRWPIAALGLCLVLSFLAAVPLFVTLSPPFILQRMILYGIGVEAVIVLLVLLAGWLWGAKIWCRTICPLGALYGLLGLRRRLFIHVDEEACTHCGRCTAACTMGTAPGAVSLAESYTCTNCGDCIDACPSQALRFTLHGRDESASIIGVDRGEKGERTQ